LTIELFSLVLTETYGCGPLKVGVPSSLNACDYTHDANLDTNIVQRVKPTLASRS